MGARTTGFVELDAKFDQLKGVTRDDVLVAAFTAGAEPVANAARDLVRVASGHLRDSIGVGTELSPHQASINGAHKGVQVFAGPGPLPEAITEEFGTLHQQPHPFLRPAWDSQQGAAITEVARVVSAEVDRIAKD